ncbi:MAG: dihydroorotase, partial [Coleofasciculus sp.]
STNPAFCLGQSPAKIANQQPAELVLFDPQQSWTVAQDTLKSLSRNTPWFGQKIRGRTVQTWSGLT